MMNQKNPVPIDPRRIFPTVFPGRGEGEKRGNTKQQPQNTPKKCKQNQNKTTKRRHQTKQNYAIFWFLSLDASHYLAYPDNDSLNIIIRQLFGSTLFPAVTSFIYVKNWDLQKSS